MTASALTVAVIVNAVTNKGDDNKSNCSNNVLATKKVSSTPLAGTKLANFTPLNSIASLQELDTTAGTGCVVKTGDTVTVDYTGAVAATGDIFQSSYDSGQPVTFGLDQVIKGWTDGVPGMKVGGTRRLLIPAVQAYGATPPSGSGIPANADLVFDITVHAITPSN